MKLDKDKVYKVKCSLSIGDEYYGLFTVDLQEEMGEWYLVFLWETNHDGEFPAIRHKIGTSLLKPSPPEGFLISNPVSIDENEAACSYVRKLSGDE